MNVVSFFLIVVPLTKPRYISCILPSAASPIITTYRLRISASIYIIYMYIYYQEHIKKCFSCAYYSSQVSRVCVPIVQVEI